MATIRKARPEDAEEISRVHESSIRTHGPQHYDPEVVEGWADGISPARHREAMLSRESMFVAEIDGRIVGFGSVNVADGEIGAVYVDPEFTRQGVGKAILERLEDVARQAGLISLKLGSSLVALRFYEQNGYSQGKAFIHTSQRTGVDIPCVWMTKKL